MSTHDYKFEYHRGFPHFQPKETIIFATFRLFGSIPQDMLDVWAEQNQIERLNLDLIEDQAERATQKYINWKRQFGRFDDFLNMAASGPRWLAQPQIAQIIADAIHHFDDKKYRLDAFCIMSNHVHIVQKPLPIDSSSYHSLASIMHSIKSFTANKCNQLLHVSDEKFWQPENYDHVIRDEGEWHRVIQYVLNNPVKAGLVDSWDQWNWSYCKYV